MYTHRYKGWYIHGNFMGRVETFKIQNPVTFEVIGVRSMHAAKCNITRRLK